MTTKKLTKQEALNQLGGFYHIVNFSGYEISDSKTGLFKHNTLNPQDSSECIDYLIKVFRTDEDNINTRLVVNDVLNKLKFNRERFLSFFVVCESLGMIDEEQHENSSLLFHHNELNEAKRTAKKYITYSLKEKMKDIKIALDQYVLESKGFFKRSRKSEVRFVKAIIQEVLKEYQFFMAEISEDDIIVNQVPEDKNIKVSVFPKEAKRAYLLQNIDFKLEIVTLDIQLIRTQYDPLNHKVESQYRLINEKGVHLFFYDTAHSTTEKDCINWNIYNNRIFISKKALYKMIKKIEKNMESLTLPS